MCFLHALQPFYRGIASLWTSVLKVRTMFIVDINIDYFIGTQTCAIDAHGLSTFFLIVAHLVK